jgi:hypothetical protein
MAISFVGSYAGTHNSTSASSVAFSNLRDSSNAAPTLQQGDLVIVGWENASTLNRSTAGGAGIGVPAGYTGILSHDYRDDSNDSNFRASYKFMGSTPDSSVSIPPTNATTAGVAYVIYVFRGVDPTTPLDVTPQQTGGTNTGVPNPPAITPSTAGAWIMVIGGAAAAAGAAMTNPTGMSAGTNHFRSAVDSARTNDPVIGAALKTDWASGAFDPNAFGGSTSTNTGSWSAITIALRPQLPPTITSADNFTTPENTAFSQGLTANEAVTWSVVGGADQAQFSFSGANLQMAAKNFESPTDADTNNTYIVTVRATSTASGLTADQTITVTVTDAWESGDPVGLYTVSGPNKSGFLEVTNGGRTFSPTIQGGIAIGARSLKPLSVKTHLECKIDSINVTDGDGASYLGFVDANTSFDGNYPNPGSGVPGFSLHLTSNAVYVNGALTGGSGWFGAVNDVAIIEFDPTANPVTVDAWYIRSGTKTSLGSWTLTSQIPATFHLYGAGSRPDDQGTLALTAAQWVDPTPTSGYVAVDGSAPTSGATGTLTKTLSPATTTSAGAVALKGQLGKTLAPATSSATSKVRLDATVTRTLAPATSSAASKVRIAGQSTRTLSPATMASAGIHTALATVSKTLAPATSTATSKVRVVGAVTRTLSPATSTSAAAVALKGSLTRTLAPATSTAVSKVRIAGQVTRTLAAATMASAGGSFRAATLNKTLSPATSSAAAKVRIAGATNKTLSPATTTSSAALALKGQVGRTLASATSASSAKVRIAATFNKTLAAATSTSAGRHLALATLSRTLSPATSSAAAAIRIGGTLTRTLGAATSAATAKVRLSATLLKTLSPATMVGDSDLRLRAQLSRTLSPATTTSAATLLIRGQISRTLSPATMLSTGVLQGLAGGVAVIDLEPATSSAVAKLLLTGQVSRTLSPATGSATSQLRLRGQLTKTLSPATMVGVASSAPSGTLNATLAPATMASAADLYIRSAVSRTLAPATAAASAKAFLRATLGVTLAPATLSSSSGAPPSTGALNVTLSPASSVGASQLWLRAALGAVLQPATATSTSNLPIKGTMLQPAGLVSLTAAGRVFIDGILQKTLGAATLFARGAEFTITNADPQTTLDVRGSTYVLVVPETPYGYASRGQPNSSTFMNSRSPE